MKRITLEILSINNYRNCTAITLKPHLVLNVLTGENGAGKTSILDAIYTLTNGKSFFAHKEVYLYQEGSNYYRLEGTLAIDDNRFITEISSSESTKKRIKLDDKMMKSLAEYHGRFSSFMIAPKDIQILVDSSTERRRLVNKTLSQIDKTYFNHLLDYNKLLKQRNAALKNFQKTRQINRLLFEAIDEKILQPALYITQARKHYVEAITPLFQKFYNIISEGKEALSIQYKSSLQDQDFKEQLSQNFEKDCFAGITTHGIHRDDIEMKINDKELKKYASQGQLKSSIISLKLAQVAWIKNETNKIPILLLDDIFDKLDAQRVERLIALCFDQLKGQIFISDTELESVNLILKKLNIDYTHFLIKNGNIAE
ncbi:MAG: DNA replication and repair protein RecF [Saprospiraceae bacterium]|nr:DNA replication and repair protein RecF [Saprospiraceae bacterium]